MDSERSLSMLANYFGRNNDVQKLPIDVVKALYNDRQFLPSTRFRPDDGDIRNLKWRTFRTIKYILMVLPFIIDYLTDIINSGTAVNRLII